MNILSGFSQMTDNIETQTTILYEQAKTVAEQGNKTEAVELYLKVAAGLVEEKRITDLVMVLANLAKVDENKTQAYLAQAIWMTLALEMPFQGLITLFVALFRLLPPNHSLVALIGTTIIYSCSEYEEDSTELEQYRELGMNILQVAYAAEGTEETESFRSWFSDRQLDDAEFFLPELMEQLENLVADTWLFDRITLNRKD